MSLHLDTDRHVTPLGHRQTCRSTWTQIDMLLHLDTDRHVAPLGHRQTCRSTWTQTDMLLHLDTVSWFRDKQSLLLLLTNYVVFGWTWPGLGSMIYLSQGQRYERMVEYSLLSTNKQLFWIKIEWWYTVFFCSKFNPESLLFFSQSNC
jgi:hypothetical protein